METATEELKAHNSAIERGLDFIYRFGTTQKCFADYGSFLICCFALVAATSRDAKLRSLGRERAGWADAFAAQIRATLAMIAGERERAAAFLDVSERSYAAADMRLHATVVRLRRGQLEGGTTGATLATGARDAMRDQGIGDPDAMARLLCPWPA